MVVGLTGLVYFEILRNALLMTAWLKQNGACCVKIYEREECVFP